MAQSREVAPLTFEARLTKAPGLTLFGGNEATGKEYFLTLKGTGNVSNIPGLQEIQDEEIEFLLILDRSGSMDGNPWRQVQRAVLKVMHMIQANHKLALTIMIYAARANFLTLSSDFSAAEKQVLQLQASGATNFVSVFDTVNEMLKTRCLQSETTKTNQPKKRNIVAYFMTDGCDTCNTHEGIMASREKLKKTIASYGQVVHIHALGFGSNHNEEFLESLTLTGTSDGSYNYIDPSMGDNALEERIVSLLSEVAGLVGRSVHLNLSLSGDNLFLGDWFGSGCQTSVLSAFFESKGDQATIETTKFVHVPTEEAFEISVGLLQNLHETTVPLVCNVSKVEFVQEPSQEESERLEVRKLRTGFNFLTNRLGDITGENNPSEEMNIVRPWYDELKERTEKAQKTTPKDSREKDKDLDELIRAAEIGLDLAKKVMEPEKTLGKEELRKEIRGMKGGYQVMSRQMHNKVQSKTKERASKDRSNWQMSSGMMD